MTLVILEKKERASGMFKDSPICPMYYYWELEANVFLLILGLLDVMIPESLSTLSITQLPICSPMPSTQSKQPLHWPTWESSDQKWEGNWEPKSSKTTITSEESLKRKAEKFLAIHAQFFPSTLETKSSQGLSPDLWWTWVIFILNLGVHVNGIEYPVVKIGQARLRVSIMPQHTKEHLDTFVRVFEKALAKATVIFERQMKIYEEQCQKEQEAKLWWILYLFHLKISILKCVQTINDIFFWNRTTSLNLLINPFLWTWIIFSHILWSKYSFLLIILLSSFMIWI